VERAEQRHLLTLPDSLHLEIDLPNATAAELASGIPGVQRVNERTIGREVASADELLGLIMVSYNLAQVSFSSVLSLINRK
jgi:D-aminopeptidase